MPTQSGDADGGQPLPPRVLLVDDHLDSADMYAFALQALNMQSFTAATADEAYALAREHRPNVIVSDLQLASASGFDLARRLRASRETSDAAIIILTGRSEGLTEIDALAAGCDRFLVKPCLPAQLASTIREVLALRKARPRSGS
jgi:DNA-binding response OmpR family regulator